MARWELCRPNRGSADVAVALAEKKARYEELFMQSPYPCTSVDTNGVLRAVNQSCVELIGYGRNELIGKPVLELYADTPAGKERARHLFRRFLSGKGFLGEEVQLRRADGSLLWVSLSVRPIFDAGGRLVASSGVWMNISDNKYTDELQKKANETLQRLVEQCLELLDREPPPR